MKQIDGIWRRRLESLKVSRFFRRSPTNKTGGDWIRGVTSSRFLAAAAGKPLSRSSRGQPRNIPAYLVIRDLDAIYAYLTQKEATRIVHRMSHAESGPFSDFAAASWPVAFGQGDDGLAAAIKNWSPWRRREKSPAIANIGLRHPEWEIFER